MDIMQTVAKINTQLKRIRRSVEPNAAVAVEAGRFTYQRAVPVAGGQYDIADISAPMPANDMLKYLKEQTL